MSTLCRCGRGTSKTIALVADEGGDPGRGARGGSNWSGRRSRSPCGGGRNRPRGAQQAAVSGENVAVGAFALAGATGRRITGGASGPGAGRPGRDRGQERHPGRVRAGTATGTVPPLSPGPARTRDHPAGRSGVVLWVLRALWGARTWLTMHPRRAAAGGRAGRADGAHRACPRPARIPDRRGSAQGAGRGPTDRQRVLSLCRWSLRRRIAADEVAAGLIVRQGEGAGRVCHGGDPPLGMQDWPLTWSWRKPVQGPGPLLVDTIARPYTASARGPGWCARATSLPWAPCCWPTMPWTCRSLTRCMRPWRGRSRRGVL